MAIGVDMWNQEKAAHSMMVLVKGNVEKGILLAVDLPYCLT